jgi:isopenicillin N synthase-like dioxygenase
VGGLPSHDLSRLEPCASIQGCGDCEDASQSREKQTIEHMLTRDQYQTTHGFLYLSTGSTPFTQSLLSEIFSLSSSLFSLSADEKTSFWIDTNNRGYTGIGNEKLDPANQKAGDQKEAWNFGEFNAEGKLQQGIPERIDEKTNGEVGEDVLRRFEEACRECCKKLFEGLALGLQISEEGQAGKDWFTKRHGIPSGSIVRLLKYPPTKEGMDVGDIGAGAHSDYGSVTLLFQREGGRGLEIRDDDGGWKGVDVVPKGYDLEANGGMPPIVVNVGDLLQYWTNGLLKSTVHRVVMPAGSKENRYSIVYFCHPSDSVGLVPVPSKVVQESANTNGDDVVGYGGGTEGRAMTAKEHLMRRLEATYGSRKE